MLSTLGGSTYFFLLLVPSQGWNETDLWAAMCLMHCTKGIFNLLTQLWRDWSKNSPYQLPLYFHLAPWLPLPTKCQAHWFSLCFSSIKLIAFHLLTLTQMFFCQVISQWFLFTIQVLVPFISLMTSSERPPLMAQLKAPSVNSIKLLYGTYHGWELSSLSCTCFTSASTH